MYRTHAAAGEPRARRPSRVFFAAEFLRRGPETPWVAAPSGAGKRFFRRKSVRGVSSSFLAFCFIIGIRYFFFYTYFFPSVVVVVVVRYTRAHHTDRRRYNKIIRARDKHNALSSNAITPAKLHYRGNLYRLYGSTASSKRPRRSPRRRDVTQCTACGQRLLL